MKEDMSFNACKQFLYILFFDIKIQNMYIF